MSLSRAVYTADGSNKQFDITFGYLTQAHVQVTVYDADGVSNPVNVAFSFVTPTKVELSAAPVAGKKVRVWRNISVSSPYVDFVDGAELNEQNLDNNSKALLHVAQRAIDDSEDALAAAGNIDVSMAQAADHAANALVSKNASAASEANALTYKNASEAARDVSTAARDVTTAARDTTVAARDVTTAARDTAVAAKDTTVAAAVQVSADKAQVTADKNAAVSAKDTAVLAASDAVAALDSFDDRYLGAKAVAPATDNDGNALIVGALYYHTASIPKEMRVWNGAAWEAAYLPASGYATLIGAESLSNKTLSVPVIEGYTEGANAAAAGSSFSISLAADTVHGITTNANAAITLPAPAAGKSFQLQVAYGGAHTLSWSVTGGSSIKWPAATTPTPTSASGKTDIFNFSANVAGTAWLGAVVGQNYTT